MRVGVIVPRHPSTVGGGFTFHATVLAALNSGSTNHEFVFLYTGSVGAGEWVAGGIPIIDVQALFSSRAPSTHSVPAAEPATESVTEPTNESDTEFDTEPDTEPVFEWDMAYAIYKLGLDVVWYLDLPAEALPAPVFTTVLDLAHRQHPFFPEVSIFGWDWESRESHYRRVLPRAARIFVGTQTGKEQIVHCYGVNPANVIVNPFPTPIFARPEPAQDDEVIVRYGLDPGFLFYPAQFWPHKNHVNLLLALKHLETEHGLQPDLVLTGSDQGNLAHVRRVAEELGLQQRVHFLGFVSNSDLAALYRRAAALVFPSLFGPDNLPPLEAFSLGCPVLVARIEGVEEQLGSVAAGFFDPTRPEDIAAVIARVLGNSNYRAGLIINGRELAARRTPEAYVKVVLRALDEFEPWRRNWPAAAMR